MNDLSPAAVPPARPPGRAWRVLTRTLACALLAGIIPASALPALASASSARSRTSSPSPRAFFGLGPASKTRIDGRAYFNWSATPGARLTDHVAVVNFGVTPVAVRLFVTNAVSTGHGGTGFEPAGGARGGPADWVLLLFPGHSPMLRLAPRSSVIVPIIVVIPKNAPPGDHVGAIVASLTSVIQSKNHAKVHLVQQVADRIIARISGRLHPQLSIAGLKVAYGDPLNPFATGAATLTFAVRNSGNELLGGRVSVSVSGLLGLSRTRANVVTVPVMLPGGSDRVGVRVTGVYPQFWMTARVTIAPLIVAGQYDQGLAPYSGQVGFLAIPWVPFVIVILLALIAAVTWLRRRQRRSRAPAPPRGAGMPRRDSEVMEVVEES